MNGHARDPEAQPRITRDEALDRAARVWAEVDRMRDQENAAFPLRDVTGASGQVRS